MKIKVLMALAVLPLLAFECCDDTDTWQFRCQRGSEFTLYPQDVLDEVIGESLMSLNFVQSVIDSHNGNPSLGIHSVKDGTGWEYLVENRIEKSDTIWFDARRRMRIRNAVTRMLTVLSSIRGLSLSKAAVPRTRIIQ